MEDNTYISSLGRFKDEDAVASDDMKKIDSECRGCLYSAGRITETDVLSAVIENELTETERLVVKQYWFRHRSFNTIAQSYGIPKETVRRIYEKSKKKIYSNMKYVVLYNYLIDGRQPLPADFNFKIIRCADGKETVA